MSKTKITKKLVKILSEAQKVKKSGMNTFQNYQYTTESDLLELLRPKLVEAGVFIYSSVKEVTKDNDITTVIMEHTFVDSESGEEIVVNSAGQGADKQDKGIYKALTGSMKYMLWKNFLIESNDDPESDNANPGYVRGGSSKKTSTTKTSTAAAAPKSFSKRLSKTTAPTFKKEEPTVTEETETKEETPKRRTFGKREFVSKDSKTEANF